MFNKFDIVSGTNLGDCKCVICGKEIFTPTPSQAAQVLDWMIREKKENPEWVAQYSNELAVECGDELALLDDLDEAPKLLKWLEVIARDFFPGVHDSDSEKKIYCSDCKRKH